MVTAAPDMPPDVPRDDLIACPQCDRLNWLRDVPVGATARCPRCRTVLLAPRRGAIAMIVSLSVAALTLMVAAISFPFLRIETTGLSSQASVLDAIAAFAKASGLMAPLSFTMALMIVILPATRLCALLYALGPVYFGHTPRPQAARVFRMAMRLRPWAMAEVFIIGVGVALIKVASLASVEFGAAFWAFVGLVLLMAAQDIYMCERSLWRLLQP